MIGALVNDDLEFPNPAGPWSGTLAWPSGRDQGKDSICDLVPRSGIHPPLACLVVPPPPFAPF